jgi:hypothetical protein
VRLPLILTAGHVVRTREEPQWSQGSRQQQKRESEPVYCEVVDPGHAVDPVQPTPLRKVMRVLDIFRARAMASPLMPTWKKRPERREAPAPCECRLGPARPVCPCRTRGQERTICRRPYTPAAAIRASPGGLTPHSLPGLQPVARSAPGQAYELSGSRLCACQFAASLSRVTALYI